MPTLLALSVIEDNDPTVDITVLQADGVTAQDITGLSPVLVIKPSADSPDSSGTTITTSGGLTVTDAVAGTLTAFIPHTLLESPGRQWYRVDVIDGGGDTTTVLYGPFTIIAA